MLTATELKLRAKCRHQMEVVMSDLIWRHENRSISQAVSLSRVELRPCLLPIGEADADYLTALDIGDELENWTGKVGDPTVEAERLLYVARQHRLSVRRVLRCWRLWIAYRVGLLDGITQLGPAEIVARIRDVDGAVYSEWCEADEFDARAFGPAGTAADCLSMQIGSVG